MRRGYGPVLGGEHSIIPDSLKINLRFSWKSSPSWAVVRYPCPEGEGARAPSDPSPSGPTASPVGKERKNRYLYTPATTSQAPGLTDTQRDFAHRTAERLRAEFGALIESLPLDSRTIAAVSEWLDITGPVCQRLLRGTRYRGEATQALLYFPGVRGLREVVNAASRKGCDPAQLAAAEAAVSQYAHLIGELGGSQVKLIERLSQPKAEKGDEPRQEGAWVSRQAAFEAQRLLTRREFDTQFAVFVYAPRAEDASRMDCLTAMGMIGIRRQPGSLPIVPVQTFDFGERDESKDARPEEDSLWPASLTLLDRFCSTPLPSFVPRRIGGRIPVLLDPDRTAKDPLDVVLGSRFEGVTNCALHAPKTQYCSLISEGPSRNLILQVHLHRSLAQRSVASADCYVVSSHGRVGETIGSRGGQRVVDRPEDRWFDRLPDRPRLEYLGLGLDHVENPIYPRAGQLTESLFEGQGWDPRSFVGYRCMVRYPMWGTQYVMSFLFDTEEDL